MKNLLPLLAIAAAFLMFSSKSKLRLRLKESSGAFDTLIAEEVTPDGVAYWEFIVPAGIRPSSLPVIKARVDPEDWTAATPL